MLHRAAALQRAPLEDGRLGGSPGYGIVSLQGEKQRLVGVARKSLDVLARRYRAVPGDKGIVGIAEKLAGLGNVFFGRIVKLGLKHQPHGITHSEHAADAPGDGGGQVGRLEAITAPDNDHAVALGKRPVLHGAQAGTLRRRHSGMLYGPCICGDVNARRQRRNGSAEICGCHLSNKRRFAASIHSALKPHLPEHHVQVTREILIDEYRSVRRLDGSQVPPRLPPRSHAPPMFLQEENVGGDFGAGVRFECGVGKAFRADQARAFGQIPSDGRILLVHCVAAGNECHDAALAHLVERFGEEVVVNRVGKGRIGAVSGIEDRVVSKWNIAHDSIKVIVRQDCLFKSLGENGRVRVEPLGDARREAVEFHAGSAASGRERLRHESEEMPDTHRRLQNLRTGRKTEALQSLPHPGNHHGRGEMSVGRGSACRSIFVFRENLAQLVRDLLPLARWLRMEDIRQRSPPAVARKDGLLGVGRVPVSGFKLFKRADTDAAGEGLNLQFAGVLVNYDLPWNPMKVEQRIGRIDRLGQPRPVIRVLSFAYKDTVEQDVFFTVGNRINLFQGIVGRLQPILSRLPRRFEELALLDRDARETARQRFLADLEQQVRDADESGFDIEVTVEGSLDLPSLPEPALTLRDLDRAIQIARARPPEVDFRPLDPGSYGIGLPGGGPIRVTTDAGVFEFSSDNFQLFSPGGDAFGAFCVDGSGGGAGGRGIAWMVQRPGAEAEFVVATRSGPRTVGSFEELLAALDVVGEPCEFPLGGWPGVTASVIA